MTKRNGSPYDRGGADSYYGRGFVPHYFTGPSYASERIDLKSSDPLYFEYLQGYEDNERSRNYVS